MLYNTEPFREHLAVTTEPGPLPVYVRRRAAQGDVRASSTFFVLFVAELARSARWRRVRVVSRSPPVCRGISTRRWDSVHTLPGGMTNRMGRRAKAMA